MPTTSQPELQFEHQPPSRFAVLNKTVRTKIRGGWAVQVVRKEKHEVTADDRAFLWRMRADWAVWCYLNGVGLRVLGDELKLTTKEDVLAFLDRCWGGEFGLTGSPVPILEFTPWTARQDRALLAMVAAGMAPGKVCEVLARTVTSVKARRRLLA